MRFSVLLLLGIILFLASEILLVLFGLVKVYFVLFVPVFVSSSAISILPIIFFLVPLLAGILGSSRISYPNVRESNFPPREEHTGTHETKYGGLVMIGPIPIIFGKGIDSRILIILALVAIALMIIWFILAK
jgi:uncharacterized protein (TIGR00304 family)